MAKLVCLNGNNRGEEYFLEEGKHTLGRGHGRDFIILDRNASRQHCTITKKDDTYIIEDTDSLNGTIVNKKKIHSAKKQIFSGEKFLVGDTIILLSGKETSTTTTEAPEKTDIEKFLFDETRKFTETTTKKVVKSKTVRLKRNLLNTPVSTIFHDFFNKDKK
ncbi:MAG: FHA domain-containing protein [Verrucomicrobiota bacterium]|nr:FHA domain-containing protein [Verrucomicrobiota bacterium]